jgi:hypothetical protein
MKEAEFSRGKALMVYRRQRTGNASLRPPLGTRRAH